MKVKVYYATHLMQRWSQQWYKFSMCWRDFFPLLKGYNFMQCERSGAKIMHFIWEIVCSLKIKLYYATALIILIQILHVFISMWSIHSPSQHYTWATVLEDILRINSWDTWKLKISVMIIEEYLSQFLTSGILSERRWGQTTHLP